MQNALIGSVRIVNAYLYLWWNIRILMCDVGSNLFGPTSADWCRIHGWWRGHEPEGIERWFWKKVLP